MVGQWEKEAARRAGAARTLYGITVPIKVGYFLRQIVHCLAGNEDSGRIICAGALNCIAYI